MSKTVDVVAGIGLDQKTRKSRWPARLDVVQSASGLFLGLFMWGHMAFVSTILISKDAISDGKWLRPDGRSIVVRSQLPAEPACQSCWLLFLKDFSSSL